MQNTFGLGCRIEIGSSIPHLVKEIQTDGSDVIIQIMYPDTGPIFIPGVNLTFLYIFVMCAQFSCVMKIHN